MHTAPPSGAAHQNRDRYVPLTDDERLVFFFDSTLLSSGKKGVVGTDKRIIAFQKEAARQYPIAEIERLERRVTPGPAGLIVVTRGGERDDITPLTAGPADVDAMIDAMRPFVSIEDAAAAPDAETGAPPTAAPPAAAPQAAPAGPAFPLDTWGNALGNAFFVGLIGGGGLYHFTAGNTGWALLLGLLMMSGLGPAVKGEGPIERKAAGVFVFTFVAVFASAICQSVWG